MKTLFKQKKCKLMNVYTKKSQLFRDGSQVCFEWINVFKNFPLLCFAGGNYDYKKSTLLQASLSLFSFLRGLYIFNIGTIFDYIKYTISSQHWHMIVHSHIHDQHLAHSPLFFKHMTNLSILKLNMWLKP